MCFIKEEYKEMDKESKEKKKKRRVLMTQILAIALLIGTLLPILLQVASSLGWLPIIS